MVTMSWPWASLVVRTQDLTARLSTMMVQVPQAPSEQPSLTLVSLRSSRR